MIYLSGAVRPELVGLPWIGFMLTPDMGNRPDLTRSLWGADTGCYAQGQRFSLPRYLAWLDDMQEYRATCLFATAPDVWGDGQATLECARDALPAIRERGLPAALVAQPGLRSEQLDWSSFDVLFVGGPDEWQMGDALTLVAEANQRGKWCHRGRVNSLRRLRASQLNGYGSADGTFVKYGPDKNIPRVLLWLRTVQAQPAMEMES